MNIVKSKSDLHNITVLRMMCACSFPVDRHPPKTALVGTDLPLVDGPAYRPLFPNANGCLSH